MRYSIIIPVYNVELYLRRCVDSILKQNYKEYEILLIDDGSTDNSPIICDEYHREHPNIKVIHKKNGGVHSARQIGADIAVGEYILCIDSDDYIDDNYLEMIDKNIEAYNHPSVLMWGLKNVSDNCSYSESKTLQLVPNGLYANEELDYLKSVLLFDKSIKGINFGRLLFSLCTKAIKRELFIQGVKNVKDDIKYGEDLLTTKYIMDNEMCRSIAVCDYAGYNYYLNVASSINSPFSFRKMSYYEDTITELAKAFKNEAEKVKIFSIHALIGMLFSIYKNSNNYNSFIKKVRQTYDYELIWKNASEVSVCGGIKERIKVYAVKNKRLLLIYIYFKYCIKH